MKLAVRFEALIFGLLLLFCACGVSSGDATQCTDDGCWQNLDYQGCSDDPEEIEVRWCHLPDNYDLLTQE